jgi:DNA gyrase subunit A
MELAGEEGYLLIVSKHGYGKCTRLSYYSTKRRKGGKGAKGVLTFRVTSKTGPVADAKIVPDIKSWEVLLTSAKAQVIRISLEDVSIKGRNTSGVIVWRDREPDDYVTAVTCFCPDGREKALSSDSKGNGQRRSKASTNGRATGK